MLSLAGTRFDKKNSKLSQIWSHGQICLKVNKSLFFFFFASTSIAWFPQIHLSFSEYHFGKSDVTEIYNEVVKIPPKIFVYSRFFFFFGLFHPLICLFQNQHHTFNNYNFIIVVLFSGSTACYTAIPLICDIFLAILMCYFQYTLESFWNFKNPIVVSWMWLLYWIYRVIYGEATPVQYCVILAKNQEFIFLYLYFPKVEVTCLMLNSLFVQRQN